MSSQNCYPVKGAEQKPIKDPFEVYSPATRQIISMLEEDQLGWKQRLKRAEKRVLKDLAATQLQDSEAYLESLDSVEEITSAEQERSEESRRSKRMMSVVALMTHIINLTALYEELTKRNNLEQEIEKTSELLFRFQIYEDMNSDRSKEYLTYHLQGESSAPAVGEPGSQTEQ